MSGESFSGRTVAVMIAIVALLLVGAFLVFQLVFQQPPAPSQPPPAAIPDAAPASQPASAPAEHGAVVAATRGRVELLSHGEDWSEASVGVRLGPEDAIRTGPGAEADLKFGEDSTITVAERAQVVVREVSEATQPLTLRKGRVTADWKQGARRLVIEDETGKVVAATKAARFSVLAAGESFVVATETGTVNLDAAGASTAIKAGETSRVDKGEAPTPARPLTKELLLKVASAQVARAGVCAVIKGTTEPGAEVLVDGDPVKTDSAGQFKITVPRRAGREGVRVTTRDAAGREREKVIACQAATPERDKPIEGMGVRWRVEGEE